MEIVTTPEKTYAFIVAIERYDIGNGWNLDGVSVQGEGFAHWLIEGRGVPAGNIRVFVSGVNQEVSRQRFVRLGIPPEAILEATSTNVERFLVDLAVEWPDGELLMFYWVGHGFVGRTGERRLIFADAITNLKKNLDVDQLIGLLRSDRAGKLRHQFGFVDACAKFYEAQQSKTELPPGGLSPRPALGNTDQYFYFAASDGEYATKNVFGPELLKLLAQLPAQPWPPNGRHLRMEIEKTFDTLVAARMAQQQPVWLEYRDTDGRKLKIGVLPTLGDIHDLSRRARVPLLMLRGLATRAAECETLKERDGRDRIYRELEERCKLPLNRPSESIDDSGLDLMRLIAGAAEQNELGALSDAIIQHELNSDSAVRFRNYAMGVETARGFWPLVAALGVTRPRAVALFQRAKTNTVHLRTFLMYSVLGHMRPPTGGHFNAHYCRRINHAGNSRL